MSMMDIRRMFMRMGHCLMPMTVRMGIARRIVW
jgi:hypothetical protein